MDETSSVFSLRNPGDMILVENVKVSQATWLRTDILVTENIFYHVPYLCFIAMKKHPWELCIWHFLESYFWTICKKEQLYIWEQFISFNQRQKSESKRNSFTHENSLFEPRQAFNNFLLLKYPGTDILMRTVILSMSMWCIEFNASFSYNLLFIYENNL